MSKVTRATLALDKAGVAYSVHSYSYDPGADRIGVQAAQSLLVDPARVLADETEAGRGLMVAVVQLALTAGACSAA